MFSDHLALSLLLICDVWKLNYDQAAERCGCSARHFGSIVRRQASPTLGLLEKMCTAFDQTPNQLLGVGIEEELSYRRPLAVRTVRQYQAQSGLLAFPVCPRCGGPLEREDQSYCGRCGQCLGWGEFHREAFLSR